MIRTEGVRSDAAQLVREVEPADGPYPLHGVTFADGRLWLASGRYLLHLVPETARIFEELETSPAPGGLAFDGRHLWQLSEGRLEQLEARTGLVVRRALPGLEGVTGIECIEGDLLVLHASGRRLSRVRVVQHAFADEAVVVAESEMAAAPLRGLAWIGAELWSATSGALVRIDPATAHVLQRLALPDGFDVLDLTADVDGRLWCVDGASRRVRVFVGASWTPDVRQSLRAQARPSSRVVDVTLHGDALRPVVAESPASVSGATFNRILVPVDFSAASRRTLATALLLQDRLGSEVHLFHLAQQGANAEFLAGSGASVSSGDIADDARARLLRFVDNIFPGRSGGVVAHARIGGELVAGVEAAARQIGATLVLLAGAAHHKVLRTHIERVARGLACAVMELRADEEPR